MREPDRKNAGKPENASEANRKKTDKEKIKELAKKKREMQEEIDELKGNTVKGEIVCALVFLMMIGLSTGTFAGMVKMNIGGVASEVLAPVIADVPVLRNILPVEMQKKTASELAAEQKQQEAEAQAEQAAEEEAAEEEAAEAEAAAEEAEAQAEQAAEVEATAAEAEAAAEEAKALQDYVDTYLAMKPKDAAKVFDSMMPDQEDSVVRILENITSDQRAAILSKMSTANAAILTEKMQQ